jgi:hypothetical protein
MSEENNEDEFIWECWNCAEDQLSDCIPLGWLGNSHPLCKRCADNIFKNTENTSRNRLTYYYLVGEIRIYAGLAFPQNLYANN